MLFRKRDRNNQVLRCSFCNKSQDDVEKLIASPSEIPVGAYICNECVALCNKILEEDKSGKHQK